MSRRKEGHDRKGKQENRSRKIGCRTEGHGHKGIQGSRKEEERGHE